MDYTTQHRFGSFLSRHWIGLALIGLALVAARPAVVHAQQRHSAPPEALEEIVVRFEIQRTLAEDIVAQYGGSKVYLPLVKILRLLEMKVEMKDNRTRYRGHLMHKNDAFDVDLNKGRVRSSLGEFELSPTDYLVGDMDVYIKSELFNEVFGLPVTFDFSLLRAYIPYRKSFPIIKRQLREQRHKVLAQRGEDQIESHRVPHQRELLGGGVVDWTLSTNPVGPGGSFGQMKTGAVVLGGDLEWNMAGNSRSGFDSDQMRGRWRYYTGDSRIVSHVDVGDIFAGGRNARSLRGAMVTNQPLRRRQYFQTVDIGGDVGPDWEVELYVNNQLRDFAYTDAAGSYNFNLDVFYGGSTVQLKMYGPNGEIREEERYIQVPFTMLPKGELEYSMGAGLAQTLNGKKPYSVGNVALGIHERLTAGAGVDAPLNPSPGEKPFFNGQLALNMGRNVSAQTALSINNSNTFELNYTNPSVLNVSTRFTTYYPNEVTNRLLHQNRIAFSLSAPFRVVGHGLGLRFNATMDQYETFSTFFMNWGMTLPFRPLQLHYLGRLKRTDYTTSRSVSVASELFASINLIRWVRPQARLTFDHTTSRLSKYSIFLSKRVFRLGQLSLSYERNAEQKTDAFMVTFNLVTGFAHLSARSTVRAEGVRMNNLYRGSVRYDQSARRVRFDRNPGVGLGMAVVRPFRDDNFNGRFDADEALLGDLRAKMHGQSGTMDRSNRLYFYNRLQPYGEYSLDVNSEALPDPMLRPSHRRFRVTLNPNMVSTIDVPVVTASDIMGSVKRQTDAGDVGIGGVKLTIINLSTEVVSELTTFNDGDFYHLGLLPGQYRAYLDKETLTAYGYRSEPESREFEVAPIPGGTSIEHIDFRLLPLE
jgi:hypothetical protein